MAWIALVPMAWCWTRKELPRSAYWSAYVGGVISHLLVLAWYRTCYNDGSVWFGPLSDVWWIISLLGGFFFLAMFWYGRRLARLSRLPMSIVLPVVWVSYELIRHHGGALFDQTGFPWAKL
ncbi:MAG: hypothetical protein ACC631_10145, partial [Halocynthiibacter sp.]